MAGENSPKHSRFERLNLNQCVLKHSVDTASGALFVPLSSLNEERVGVRIRQNVISRFEPLNHQARSNEEPQRAFLLLPGGEGRDEGERPTILGFMGRSPIDRSSSKPNIAFHKYLFYKFPQKQVHGEGEN